MRDQLFGVVRFADLRTYAGSFPDEPLARKLVNLVELRAAVAPTLRAWFNPNNGDPSRERACAGGEAERQAFQ
jgi:hypothetical protein